LPLAAAKRPRSSPTGAETPHKKYKHEEEEVQLHTPASSQGDEADAAGNNVPDQLEAAKMSSDEEGAEYFDYEDEGFDDEDVDSE